MPDPQKLTVICLALGQIVIDDRYLLTANREQYRKSGTRTWEPPGEVIETLASDMHQLGKLLGAKSPGESAILHFSIPEGNLRATTKWFGARKPDVEGSHQVIIRHLASDWRGNEPLLLHPGLIRANVAYLGWSWLAISIPLPGPQPNRMTHYFVRVFRLSPQAKAIDAIRRELALPNSPLALVTTEEIAAGRTTSGEAIAPLAMHLAQPQHPYTP